MKYIRTKDGIYEAVTQNLYKNDDLLYIDGYGLERVIAQANTIEELCDEFVVDFNGKKIISALPFDRSLNYGGDELFGAIWTDKGLIYVAKMNESGCLELL